MAKLEYKNLTELLLKVVRPRPGIYLGTNGITKLPNFIEGYYFRDLISIENQDFYFGENGFLNWYTNKHNLTQENSWLNYFLKEANNNEVTALDIFFKNLEEYHNWYKNNLSTGF